MPRTNADREQLLDRVEVALLQGIRRPTALAKAVPGLTRQSASRYAKMIEQRWGGDSDDRDKLRRRLIREAEHVMRRAWEAYAHAFNSNNHNAASSALRRVLDAQERIAKLSGLDTERIEHSIEAETLDRLQADAIAAAEREVEQYGDPISVLYGACKP